MKSIFWFWGRGGLYHSDSCSVFFNLGALDIFKIIHSLYLLYPFQLVINYFTINNINVLFLISCQMITKLNTKLSCLTITATVTREINNILKLLNNNSITFVATSGLVL